MSIGSDKLFNPDPKVSTYITIAITFVWATSAVGDILVKGYDPSPYINFIMMAVAGAIFGRGIVQSNGKANNRQERNGTHT